MTYFLVGVPHYVLDILSVRVYDSDTLVLVFFIHCETPKIGHFKIKTRDAQMRVLDS